jgi:phosphoglycolate phosphatase-like HAD superfamily hydrolase
MAHLVWDWNGTLLNDLTLILEATNASLAAVGGPSVTLDAHRKEFRRPVSAYYAAVLGRPLRDREFDRINQVFSQVYRGGLLACPLAVDALAAMENWGGTQSLLSMWSHGELMPELRRRGLVDRLVRADGTPGGAMGDLKAGYLTAHLAAIGIPGPDCVLVGDSVDDADAAAAVGARCVLYSGGITDPVLLGDTGHPVAASLLEAVTIASTLVTSAL